MQNYNYQGYYHSQNLRDFLDNESNKDKSEDESNEEDEELDPDFQDP